MATRAVLMLSGLVVNVVLGRMLSKADFGDYQWILSLTALANFGATLGLGAYVTREVSRTPEDQPVLVRHALVTAGLSSAGVGVLIAAYAAWVHDNPDVVRAAGVAAVVVALNGAAQLLQGGFQGLRRMKLELPAVLVGRLTLVASQLALVAVGASMTAFFLGRLLAAAVLVGGLLFVQWRRVGPLTGPVELARVRGMGVIGRAFGATVLFGAVYAQADTIMLQALTTSEEVARYRAPAAVLLQLAFVATIVTRGMFPKLAQAMGDAVAVTRELVFQTRILLLVSLPVAVGGVLVATPLITAVFDSDYADAGGTFALLLLAVPLRFLNNGYGFALTALNKQSQRWRLDAAGAVFNVALNAVIIPAYGAVGAAATTLATDAALLVALRWAVGGVTQGFDIRGPLVRVGAAAAAMGAVVWFAAPLGVWAQVGVGALVYPALAWLTGGWARADLGRLRRV